MRLSTSEPQRRNRDFEFDDEVNTERKPPSLPCDAPATLTGF